MPASVTQSHAAPSMKARPVSTSNQRTTAALGGFGALSFTLRIVRESCAFAHRVLTVWQVWEFASNCFPDAEKPGPDQVRASVRVDQLIRRMFGLDIKS
jgi:hypothetical protein